jgi:hypothetical protein
VQGVGKQHVSASSGLAPDRGWRRGGRA